MDKRSYTREMAERLRVACDMAESDVVHAERALADIPPSVVEQLRGGR